MIQATSRQLTFLFLALFVCLLQLAAQNAKPVQQLRGTVADAVLGTPLEGVTVTLPALNLSAVTDARGEFRFASLPIGTYTVQFSSTGYKESAIENLVVSSGKEAVLSLSMTQSVKESEAVIVKASSRKNKPLNEMSAVSARAFSVEETQKYAAAVNDPLRMAAGFPGVFAIDDGNNSIAIRGNSPTGLLWRMEGVDIPNPNHFSNTGSSGGGISILSSQLLTNSDFVTSAFAAEYGNALSGVFDLKLRKGNNEKKEYTLQAGLLGLNAAAEGPIMPFYKGSYLVNYRYSTLSLLDKLGVTTPGGTTNFQDLSYNVYLPTKRMGQFTLFGFGGLSSQNVKATKDSSKWTDKSDRYSSKFRSNTGTAGITHQLSLGAKTTLRSAAAYSLNQIGDEYHYVTNDYHLREDFRDRYTTGKWSLNTTLHHRFSGSLNMRAGLILSQLHLNYFKKEKEDDNAPLLEVINKKDVTQTVQGFAQWQYKPVDALTVNAGWHYLRLAYNGSQALEPRMSIRWQAGRRDVVAVAYGGHSQLQALGVYFAQTSDASGAISYPNKKLGLTRAHHYVASYQHSFAQYLSVKAELYYQQLYKVPVANADTGSFSVLNIQSEYVTDALANKGKGRNYGLELSIEKYLSRRYYFTASTSLYESKYTAADGRERDTRFNGNYLFNVVAGKEFPMKGGLKTFGVNMKTIYAGGLRNTPINLERSIAEGKAVYNEDRAFTEQNPAYFRADLRLSLTWNRKSRTSTLSLDIQNLSNRENVYGQWFDNSKGRLVTSYQTGLIPILNYKIEF